MPTRLIRLVLPVALVWLVACAHDAPPAPGSVAELQQTVATLRAQNAAYLKQIEELENQVFILSDRATSEKNPEERAPEPKLPTVRLHPGSETPDPTASELAHEIVIASADDPTVEYAGEAARTSTRRPVLKIVGNEPTVATAEPAASPIPPPRTAAPIPRAGSRGVVRPAPAGVVTGNRAVSVYRRALEALQGGRHPEAAAGFREFLRLHPSHEYADNAQYWLAECYYDLKDFGSAAREFRRVVDVYPQGNKVPDALLKLGFAHLSQGDREAGRKALAELVRAYPQHDASTRASERLEELEGGTHKAAPAASAGRAP